MLKPNLINAKEGKVCFHSFRLGKTSSPAFYYRGLENWDESSADVDGKDFGRNKESVRARKGSFSCVTNTKYPEKC